jgi:hypothetical protein
MQLVTLNQFEAVSAVLDEIEQVLGNTELQLTLNN